VALALDRGRFMEWPVGFLPGRGPGQRDEGVDRLAFLGRINRTDDR
jgi:hypothetical protein